MLNDKKIQDHIAEFQNNKKLNQIMQSEDNLNEQNCFIQMNKII